MDMREVRSRRDLSELVKVLREHGISAEVLPFLPKGDMSVQVRKVFPLPEVFSVLKDSKDSKDTRLEILQGGFTFLDDTISADTGKRFLELLQHSIPPEFSFVTVLSASLKSRIQLPEHTGREERGGGFWLVVPSSVSVRVALAYLLEALFPESPREPRIDPTAVIHPEARIHPTAWIGPYTVIDAHAYVDAHVEIYPFVYVGERVHVGERTRIYPGAILYPGVQIGKYCIIHAGAIIGADGFGYAFDGERYVRIPQIGGVRIEDFVEIGACTAIDRATLTETVIQEGTKIDNLVQIAHNVSVGRHTVIVSQTGIAGSSTIGSYCQIGGQVGIADHVQIGDRVRLAARTAVNRDIRTPGDYAGVPPQPFSQAMKMYALMRRLPELFQEVARLRKEVEELRQTRNP